MWSVPDGRELKGDVLAGGGNLALPSLLKKGNPVALPLRPSTSHALAPPDVSRAIRKISGVGKDQSLEQYQDIMFSNIALNQRQHRRVKSDVTTPAYELPKPPAGTRLRQDYDSPPSRSEREKVCSPAQVRALVLPTQNQEQIILRGAGHRGDGEILPSQQQLKKASVQNIISGLF